MDVSYQISEAIAHAKSQAKSAEEKFDFAAEMISIKSSSSIDLFGSHATSQVADIAAMTREACDELYATYQMLVVKIDMECKPLLDQNPDVNAVCEVAETIKWLNKESAISTNFSGSINGGAQRDLLGVRYVPSIENKMIEKFWESKLAEMPGAYTARKDYEQRQIEERRAAKEAERRRKQELEEYEKKKAEQERQARLARFAENAANVEDRRKHLRMAQYLIGCGPNAHAYVTPEGKAHVAYNREIDFGDYEAYRPSFEAITDFRSVVCTRSAVVGLRKNGTCYVAYGRKPIDAKSDEYAAVKTWTRVKKLAAGFDHVVGLRVDGTCVCSKLRAGNSYGSWDVDLSSWNDIQDIACGIDFIIGLKSDGTVLHAGGTSNTSVRDQNMKIVKWLPCVSECKKWTDVALIGAGSKSVYGVTKSGEILWAGQQELTEEAANAENIVQIAVAGGLPYFLQADGKVIGQRRSDDYNSGSVIDKNVVAMSAGYVLLLLKENGKLDYYSIGHSYIAGSSSVKLFDNYDNYIAELKAAAEAAQKQLQRQKAYCDAGVCQHCGGAFKKSLFSCKCSQCGKKKDY